MVLLLVCSVLLVTGCGCSKKENDVDIEIEKGIVTSICKKTVVLDGSTIETIETTNYDANKDAMNYKIKAIYKFEDEEQYAINLEEIEKNVLQYQEGTTSSFKYVADEKNKVIKTVFAYLKLELGEELKEQYKAKTRISYSESDGYTCEITGADRADLGLD